jgi:hypothetical protein
MAVIKATSKSAQLLAGFLASSFVVSAACAQAPAHGTPGEAGTTVAMAAPDASRAREFNPVREGLYLKRNWGVEVIGVKPVSSGQMLTFRYRIVDAEKAKMLNDRKARAYVIDEASGIRLAVPAMEKVGELRSGSAPEEGRIYFMVFGNPGKVVKSGSRVSVVVGNFRVDGLVVN